MDDFEKAPSRGKNRDPELRGSFQCLVFALVNVCYLLTAERRAVLHECRSHPPGQLLARDAALPPGVNVNAPLKHRQSGVDHGADRSDIADERSHTVRYEGPAGV